MSGVITHAYTPWLNVDAMSEQECREALKDLLQEAFAKDQQLIELKTGSHKLNDMLVKLLDLFISENYSKLHAEMKPMAEYLQEQRAAKAARKVH
ncbi:hypothetical protein [Pseudomonas sp. 273]|uniref:hypothetical protein n=1 Tax=Pseudomonas sp. 273 TaxID=75692 RepID=UPI0023D80589|nr:hypothetical protein [Pseudomonas sp. 273]